jgi:hypothetical protein
VTIRSESNERVGRRSYCRPLAEKATTVIFAAQAIVASFLATVKDYPPRQKAASFTIDQAMAKMSDAASGAGR